MPEPLNRGVFPETAVPRITLSDGSRIPQIGLGVLRIGNGDVSAVVRAALESGYRHIDTAAGYGNEAGTGGRDTLRRFRRRKAAGIIMGND